MSGNTFNDVFRITTFGESHGVAVGCVLDGCPAGLELTEEDIQLELDKRKPGQSDVSTPRDESDTVEILSGVFEGKTTGTPIAMVVRNKDQNSKDYSNVKDLFRPGHADFGFDTKFGHRDYRGGGRASGRETAARVMAGAIALKVLDREGIEVHAYTKSINEVESVAVDFDAIEKNEVRTCDASKADEMIALILEKKEAKDSVGGVIECQALGLPAGLGSPVFDKIEARLSHALMSIGAVKGFEIGSGFAASRMLGSEHNDNITALKDGRLEFEYNHSGGTLGGMTTGAPLVLRAAIKPTSSIEQEQTGVDRDGHLQQFVLEGRHDPCIVPRAVPVIRSMVALVLVDELLKQKTCSLD